MSRPGIPNPDIALGDPYLPSTVREQILACLELELIPNRPEPYEPRREPITPERAARNLHVLALALTKRTA